MNRVILVGVASVVLTQAVAAGAVDVNVPLTGTRSGFGESGSAFIGQTFLSPGGLAQQLTVYVGPTTDPSVPFRILITEMDTGASFGPTDVLFESGTVTKNFSFPLVPEPFTVDLGGLALQAGTTYAVVLDACSEFDGTLESADVGIDGAGSYASGVFFEMPPNPTQPVPCDRDLLFDSRDWDITEDIDLAFTLTFGGAGEEVAIDVRPGNCLNQVNTLSSAVLPVAILGAAEFDVRTIDLTSIHLEGIPPLRSHFVDIGSSSGFPDPPRRDCARPMRDAFEDLLVQFSSQALVAALGVGIEEGDVLPVTLTGSLLEEFGGGPFIGEDTILIRKPRGAQHR